METASRNPTPIVASLQLEGEEITGGTLPRGCAYVIGAPLPTRWGLLRWQGHDRAGAVEVMTPQIAGHPLPRAFSRISLVSHRCLARALGSLSLASGHELVVLERPAGETLVPPGPGGARDPVNAMSLLSDIAGALDAIHAADICHLEVRPEHIVTRAAPFDQDPAVDAPVARLLLTGAARATEELQPGAGGGAARTNEGLAKDEVISVCAYLAPEQLLFDRGGQVDREPRSLALIDREAVDRRADVYALAVLSYQVLTGVLPFGPDGAVDTIAAHLNPQRPCCTHHRPDLSEAVEQVLQRGFALSPADRQPSCGELVDDLRAAIAMLPTSGRRLEPRPSACILVVAGTPTARLELQGLVTAVAPRQPVLTDGGPHGRTLALRYCPRLCVLHQPSLPAGAAARLARQLLQEPLLRRTRIVAVVDYLGSPAAQELQQLGITLAPQPSGSGRSPRGDSDRRPLITVLRRLLAPTL